MDAFYEAVTRKNPALAAAMEQYSRNLADLRRASEDCLNGDLSPAAFREFRRNIKSQHAEITRMLRNGGHPTTKLVWTEPLTHVEYTEHPAAAIFPLMDGIPFAELCADIKQHGQQEPIVLSGNQIADGRNRLRACQQLKIDPLFVDFDSLGLSCTVEQYIWSANIQRRHLTEDQRAAIAMTWKERFSAEAKKRQQAAGGDKISRKSEGKPLGVESPQPVQRDRVETPLQEMERVLAEIKPGRTREKLADAARVSEHKIRTAEEVQAKRPDLLEKVISGEIGLAAARQQTAPAKPRVEQVVRSFGQAASDDRKKIGAIITATLKELPRAQHNDYMRALKADLTELFSTMRI